MSKGNVDKFLELMQTDEGLARRMAACLYMLENGGGKAEGSGGFIAREIVPLAKEYGFEFTEQDFLDYTNEATAKAGLTDEDLAEVSGGKGGVRAALMGTLALLGVAAAPAAMEMVSGGEVAPFSMVTSAETPNEEESEQATPEQLEELQLYIAALKSLKGTISSSKLEKKEKDMLSRRCVSFLNKGEESLNSKLKKDVEQSVKDIDGFVNYLRSQGVTSTWSANATANGVDVLKVRAGAVLERVKQVLKNDTIEEMTLEIKNVQEFLQFLDTKNIDDPELKKKRSDLSDLIYDLACAVLERVKHLLKNGTVKEISVERKSAQEFWEILYTKNIDDPELKEKRNELSNWIYDLGVKEIDLYIDIHELKKLKVVFDYDIDQTEKSIKELTEDNLRTTLENTLEEALNTALTKRKTFTEALENINAGNSSDVLQNAHQQYNDFVSEIRRYLEGLKAEVDEALKTEAVESRILLVKLIERLEINGNTLEDCCKGEYPLSSFIFLKKIRSIIANIKTVKASYDKLDELNALIAETKTQFGKYIIKCEQINKIEQDKIKLRKELDETDTSGRIESCVNEIENKIENKIDTLNDFKERMSGTEAKYECFRNIISAVNGTIVKLDNLENSIENVKERIHMFSVEECIFKLRERIENFGGVTCENAMDKANELEIIQREVNDLADEVHAFEYNLFTLDTLENSIGDMKEQIDMFSVEHCIFELRERIESFWCFPYENAAAKAYELKSVRREVDDLVAEVHAFKEDLFIHTKKPTASIKKMLALYKNDAIKAKDEAAVAEIEKLEEELATMSEQPTDALELSRVATRLGNIKNSIPQIRALLNKATNLKKIAEQVNDDFAKNFDNIIKEIEAADSVDKINLAEETLQNAEITLRGLMRKKINEAKGLYHVATKLGVRGFERVALNLARNAQQLSNAPLSEETSLKLKLLLKNSSSLESDMKTYLGEQIDDLKEQATKLKDMATGVDDYLVNAFDVLVTSLGKIELNGDLQKIITDFNQVKNLVNERAQELAPKLVKALEIDELLENEVMGAEIQDELKAIKAALAEDKVDAVAVLKAVDDLKAAKTKMANKLLEWHKILSEYHNKGYHKEGKKDVVEINLNVLAERANQMLNGADGINLDAETLNTATALAKEIADNLNTDIAGIMDNVKNYNGFGSLDITAGTQANTLATFLREKVDIVDDLKFVDKQTRAKLATDIKHIFDQIKIDQETGKYCLSPLYNRYAVNHDDLKLICEAYDVVAEDFGERVSYTPFVEGTTETTSGWSFSSMLSSFTGAKKQNQLINKANHLINELKKVSRLDLLDVSPESREALKKDILEIGAKIKSTPGIFYGRTLSLEGVDPKETKNMQEGLAKILEFYNSIGIAKL